MMKGSCPPILLASIKRLLGRRARYICGYSNWDDALGDSDGYDTDRILTRVAAATRKVVAGEAAFERDGVLFPAPSCPFHLLMPMLNAILETNGKLVVLDFGGSLGSTYRQCRPYLDNVSVSWNVVEQHSFVAVGKAEFETDELHFFAQAEDIPATWRPNVFLLSSSLQYLERPEEVLRLAATSGSRYLIIDRTPFSSLLQDHICVQRVPKNIYPASYPVRIFSYPRLLRILADNWHLVAEFATQEGAMSSSSGRVSFDFRGLILRRI